MMLSLVRAGVAAVLFATPVIAQDKPAETQEAGPPQVTISVVDTAAPPDWELSIPVDAVIAKDVDAGRLSLRLVYPSKPLKFMRIKPTDTLTNAGFQVKAAPAASQPPPPPADPKGKPADQMAALAITIEPARADAKRLPSGRLAIAVFKVATNADEKSFDVKVEAVTARSMGPQAAALPAAAGKPAIFVVTPPGLPIFACFFYMH